MNLSRLLDEHASRDRAVRIGLIGAGKFGTMFLAQARLTRGLHIAAIADLKPARAAAALAAAGWPKEQAAAPSLAAAIKSGATHLTDDALGLIAADGLDLVIDATGNPAAGIAHVLACCAAGRSIVMVNVEADALAGPLLAERARAAGIVYSLAYGDQPALIAELVDWARTCGLPVVAAGKGTKYLPAYHQSTPDTVWGHYGIAPERAAAGGMNPQMFNSFLDGTKSAIEMTAVANATGLTPAPDGLAFPPCGAGELARVLRPRAESGVLHHKGQVEVLSSLQRDGTPVPADLRWGVYVVFEAPSDYAARCFSEYGLVGAAGTEAEGRYAAMYKPFHLIGLELGVSVASVALRREPTGAPSGFRADAVAVAKRDLRAGEMLDGEGGYTVWGRLMPAADSLALGGLPIGLAHGVKLERAIAAGSPVTWRDVAVDEGALAVRFRREMERRFAIQRQAAPSGARPAA
jgi:predicted homoserine dehydrogenase-like protein